VVFIDMIRLITFFCLLAAVLSAFPRHFPEGEHVYPSAGWKNTHKAVHSSTSTDSNPSSST